MALPATLISGNPGAGLQRCTAVALGGVTRWPTGHGSGWRAWGAASAPLPSTPTSFSNLAHQLLALHWLPFALLHLDRLLRSRRTVDFRFPGRWGHALAVAAFLALQALASFYYATFAALAVGLFLACLSPSTWWLITRRKLARLAGGRLGAGGGAALRHSLFPGAETEMGFAWDPGESEPFSATRRLCPTTCYTAAGWRPARAVVIGGYALDALFPGLATLLIAASPRVFGGPACSTAAGPASSCFLWGPGSIWCLGAQLTCPLPYAWLMLSCPASRHGAAPGRGPGPGIPGLVILAAYAWRP